MGCGRAVAASLFSGLKLEDSGGTEQFDFDDWTPIGYQVFESDDKEKRRTRRRQRTDWRFEGACASP